MKIRGGCLRHDDHDDDSCVCVREGEGEKRRKKKSVLNEYGFS